MKITIEFNSKMNLKLKNLIDREDFNERLKTAIDNGKGLVVENPFGRWVYKIKIKNNKKKEGV